MTLSQLDVERWIRPWPIAFANRKAKWDLKVLSVAQASRLYCFWEHEGRRRSIRWWAQQVANRTCPAEQHQIHSVAQYALPQMDSLTVMAVEKDGKSIVVDGNYRLIALAAVKLFDFGDRSTDLTHVGVCFRR